MMWVQKLVVLASAGVATVAASDAPRVQSGMAVSLLRVASEKGQNAAIALGPEQSQYLMGVDRNGTFMLASPRMSLLSVDDEDNIHVTARSLVAQSLDIKGNFSVGGVPQFRTVHREDFSDGKAVGWDNTSSNDIVSSCAGISMLGGFGKFSKGEVSKKITNLPPHKELRIKANYHFIDAWVGETGFMRVDNGPNGELSYAWTERHSQDLEQHAVNACGGAVGEGKFSSPIEVVIPHDKDSVLIAFGSTIEQEDPFDQSWGVSGIEVSIR